MVISEDNFAMLLTRDYFKTFASKPVANARTSTEVLIALGLDSKEAVDDMVDKAMKAGGKEPRPRHGFMVLRTFEDLDGHTWEAMWMDPSHVQSA